MCQAYKVIKIAESQIGYLEKASNKNLDDFEANAGRGNYTKYARDFEEFAGENLQGQAQEHIQEASRINEFNRQMMNDAQLLHIFGPPNF